MIANYIPIYKAKQGELKAVANAKKTHDRRMLPLFEVCRIGKSVREAKRFKGCAALTCAYLDEVADQIANVRKGKSAMVDAFQWKADSTTETGEHILPYVYSRLEALGVSVIPVIGYDRWDSDVYRLSMLNLELKADRYYCLRLDSHAIEDAEDPVFFEERILDILDGLGVEAKQCAVLLDFGDITAQSVEDLINGADRVMQVLAPMDFRFFATAGCSLPSTIDKAVKQQDSTGKVVRKEMLLWQTLRVGYPNVRWLFGDYGVRGPNTADDIISPHTNGKIRHTIDRSYYIVRGHSVQFGDGGAQMHALAKKVVDSGNYMGEDFSWGDAQILACSEKETGPGNSTTWIAIDTSHHLAWVVAEIEEFELKIAASGTHADSKM
ncbi:TPA: beta family protein [Burkholderia cenocepacia]|uniref:beta family protein n=1 Tax=Burkholderia cenocepacia TaxID=95486 RepID=UPI00075E652E|nr:beta family protein [Burkholderia cenocepacia]